MQIAGYDIEDKYLAAGAGVLVIGGILLSRKSGGASDESNTAIIKPADGLSWKDIVGQSDTGRLIGPGGPIGNDGPPGPPPLTPDPPATPDPTGPSDPSEPDDGGGGGGRKCRNNTQCGKNKKCRDGVCVPRDNDGANGGDRNRPERGERPRMPNDRGDQNANGGTQRDPRVRDHRDDKRERDGQNRADTNNPIRAEEPPAREESDRRKDKVQVTGLSGSVRINARGGRERDRGKNANANADGGRVQVGNVDRGTASEPTRVKVDASGGRAEADASGGNGNRSGGGGKKNDKRDARKKGRGGEGIAGLDSDGYGRQDGRGGTADGYVRSNPTPGGSVGGFMPVPQKFGAVGETRHTLSRQRQSAGFFPSSVRTESDIATPGRVIPGGTRYKVR